MTNEDIEKESINYSKENSWYPGETSYESDIIAMEDSFANAFKAGAKWRINSVWNDASEAPQHSGMLIAICKDGKAVLCGPNNSNWKTTVKIFRIVKWAYIEDLIPNMEDKA